ncbi:MAG: hypothetical protein WCH98_20025 [Verrucomicrobiota bacterium]
MRSLTSAFALLLLWLPFSVTATTPLGIWPSAPAISQGEGIDPAGLPQALLPAVRFQKLFLKILAGSKPADWRAEMESFCNSPADNPIAAALGEVARAWIARAQMDEIDALLRGYYRRNVRFPATLAELGPLPPSLQKDPWGGAWRYSPSAPQGFSKLAGQRYQLGPACLPMLAPLPEATRSRPQPHEWSITPREVNGKPALEFRAAKATAVIQPGGSIEGCVLLFIGDKWALMAGMDQLFAVAF